MGKLTTHVLNVAAGIPAAGVRIELRAGSSAGSLPGALALIGTALTNSDGRCAPLLEGESFRVGRYWLTFHVAEYFRALGTQLPDPPFLDEVVLAFGISNADNHYHVPLLVSPWSYSTYRGS